MDATGRPSENENAGIRRDAERVIAAARVTGGRECASNTVMTGNHSSYRLHLIAAAAAFGCSTGCHTTTTATTPDAAGADPTLGEPPSGDTVDRVEVGQYVGTWYEIASIPMGFQARCVSTTATYGVLDASTISVLNECRVDALDGDPVRIEGKATVVDAASNARLSVDFGFARAPYWIVDLAVAPAGEPYPWAVVSNPDRSALWILSRTPQLPAARYEALTARLRERGFAPERMRLTLQPSR